MKIARETCAPNEHVSYMSEAIEAAEIVGDMTGNPINEDQIQPMLPPAA